ncbi:AI-2E family transporter, partial [Patescibacteria group bacterium]|nr:AI-2E family transporter [Patescibacteria group bacterium]
VIPFAGFLGLLSKEAYEFYQDTQDKVTTGYYQQLIEENSWVYNNTQTQLERIGVSISLEDQRENLINAAKSTSSFFYSRAGALVQNIFQAFFYFFSILFILYYLFKDRKKISKTLLDLSPLPDDLEVKLMHRIAEVGKAVIFGNMITAAVQGVLGGVGFLIFGLGNGIFWGTVIGVASLIPSLGTFIVAIPASAILFIQGKWVLGILFLLYFGLIVGSIDNILKPKLIESKIKMHPLLVFVGVLGGLLVFGPLGIIYGPLIVTIFVAFVEMYRDHFREKAFE